MRGANGTSGGEQREERRGKCAIKSVTRAVMRDILRRKVLL